MSIGAQGEFSVIIEEPILMAAGPELVNCDFLSARLFEIAQVPELHHPLAYSARSTYP